MSYRRNRPPRNILLHVAAEVFSGLGAVAAPVALMALLLSGAGCEREGRSATAGGAPPAPQVPPGAAAQSGPKLRFVPDKAARSVVALGEAVVEKIALQSETPVDWRTIEVDSSCDCLLARFVETSDPKKAVVELTFYSDKLEDVDREDIDRMVYARLVRSKEEVEKSGLGDLLASYAANVVWKCIPYVMPRSIVLEKGGSGEFDVLVGQAFARDAKTPVSIFRAYHVDETKFDLRDEPKELPVESEKLKLLRTQIPFVLIESARASPFKSTVKIEFGEPPVEKSVVVEWR